MSKRRILPDWLSTLVIIAVIMLSVGGVVTLKEQNEELIQDYNTIVELNKSIREDNAKLNDDIWNLKSQLEKQQSSITILNEDLGNQEELNKKLLEENKSLKGKNKDLESKLEAKANDTRERAIVATSQMPSRGQTTVRKSFYVEATAYIALCDTGCTGVTATGIDLRENPNAKVIAVDPSIIPLGSKVHVEGYGYAIAGDTGGAIKGYKIDVHVPNTSIARDWGRKKVKITILN